MSRQPATWVVVTMTCCAILVVSRLLEAGNATVVAKCLASSGFLILALTAGVLQSPAGRIVFLGLVLSAAGDMLLLSADRQFFLFGLVSFLFAHGAYIVAFLKLGIDKRRALFAAVPLIALSAAVSLWLEPYVGADLLLAVRIYTTVITLMVIAAYGVGGNHGSLLIPAGASLFYFSDLSVAAGQFVQADFPNFVWGLPLYYGGQVLIVLGIARSPADRNKKRRPLSMKGSPF